MTSQQIQSHSAAAAGDRLVSLDQFRGYTVAGMFLVNYFGGYAVCPQIWKHTHDYISYADTIMPQFLFAVGFSLRLTVGRRMETDGSAAVWLRVIRRLLGLVLVSLVVYNVGPRAANWEQFSKLGLWEIIGEPLKRSWFQTLMHIAVTSLWILPVIHLSARARVGWAFFSCMAHVLLSYWFNYTWVNTAPNGIDGGPLGFLTWAVPAIVGTLACDVYAPRRDQPSARRPSIFRVIFAGILLMALGYGISCGTRFYDVPADKVESLRAEKLAPDPVWPSSERIEAKMKSTDWRSFVAEPPFVRPPGQVERKWNYWMMSQRGGTPAYLIFSAGLSLVLYVIFYLVCDIGALQLPFFRTLGKNALLGYVLHGMVSSAVQPFAPKDSPFWYAYAALFVYFYITWLILRSFEKQGLFPRV